MKRCLFICLILMNCFSVFAQLDTTKTKELIYNNVYKNIAAYCINYAINNGSALNKNGYLNQSDFFEQCLPDDTYKLNMQISRLDWVYPIAGFMVYQVKINGFRFTSENTGKTKAVQHIDGPLAQPPSNYYLLALKLKGEFKFISGAYFVHDISKDFSLDNKNPTTFLDYLKYRTFQIQTEEIIFVKRKNNDLIYRAYSKELQRNLLIIVDALTYSIVLKML